MPEVRRHHANQLMAIYVTSLLVPEPASWSLNRMAISRLLQIREPLNQGLLTTMLALLSVNILVSSNYLVKFGTAKFCIDLTSFSRLLTKLEVDTGERSTILQ